jgi:hypothetical protein
VRNRLKRITTSGIYIPEIDGLRFLAISSVVLFHLLMELHLRSGRVIPVENGWAWLDKFLSNGYRGVHLFFLISGMILAMPFARQMLRGERPVSLRKYYLRRITRLEPPYIASILIAVLLIAVYTHGLHGISAGHVLATVFYQHNLIYGEASTINTVTWSLEIEIQFYLLAPLIMQIFRVRPAMLRRAILAALIVAISAAQYFTHHSRQFELSILYYLQYFLAGLLLADLFTLELQSAHPRRLWDVAGVGAILIGFWIPGGRARPRCASSRLWCALRRCVQGTDSAPHLLDALNRNRRWHVLLNLFAALSPDRCRFQDKPLRYRGAHHVLCQLRRAAHPCRSRCLPALRALLPRDRAAVHGPGVAAKASPALAQSSCGPENAGFDLMSETTDRS